MLARPCRLSSLLAAAATCGAVLGPADLRGLCVEISLWLAAASLFLWLLDRALHERLHAQAEASPRPLHLDATALQDIAVLLNTAVRETGGLEGRMHRVGELLRAEIGAQRLRSCLVEAAERSATEAPAVVGLVELLPAHPGFRVPRRDVRLDQTCLGRALASGRCAIDLPHGLAVPVQAGGRTVGVIELTGVVPHVDPVALEELLGLAAQALSACAEGEGIVPVAAPGARAFVPRTAMPTADPPWLQRAGLPWPAEREHA